MRDDYPFFGRPYALVMEVGVKLLDISWVREGWFFTTNSSYYSFVIVKIS